MYKCPKDVLLVKIDTKFAEQTEGGIFIDPTWKPGHYATVTGTVVGTPLGASSHIQKKNIAHEVTEGDEIAFSYSTVYNRDYTDNGSDVFEEDFSDNPWITHWSNKAGLHIVRMNRGGDKFEAALFRYVGGVKEYIEYQKGSKKEIKDIISTWMHEKQDFIKYKNAIFMPDGSELWKVDYLAAFAVKKGDNIRMVGGYVLLEYPEGGIGRQEYSGKLELWGDYRKEEVKEMRAKVLSIGTPLKDRPLIDLTAGDVVSFNKDLAQEYKFWGKNYLLIKQDHILAQVLN